MELSIIERQDNLTQVALSGRLDVMGVQQISKRFQDATVGPGRSAIFDMSHVDFIASLGLGMLLSAARSLHSQGARAVVVNPQALVLKAMETAHMPAVIPVVSTVSEAEALLSQR